MSFNPSLTAVQVLMLLMSVSMGECSSKGAPDLTTRMNRMQDRYLTTGTDSRNSTLVGACPVHANDTRGVT
jgi:hypothetical protein